MATFYIIYSESIDKFYVGSSDNFKMQFAQHKKTHFPKGFKTTATDWEPYFLIENIPLDVANRIVKHTKKQKSKEYYQSLKDDPAIKAKLLEDLSTHRNR